MIYEINVSYRTAYTVKELAMRYKYEFTFLYYVILGQL